MSLNLKPLITSLSLLTAASSASAQEQLDLSHLTCAFDSVRDLIADDGKFDAQIDLTNKDGNITMTVNTEHAAFFNVVTRQYELQEHFAITVRSDSTYQLVSQAEYQDTSITMTIDNKSQSIEASGDPVVIHMHQESFRDIQRIADECLDPGTLLNRAP